MKTILYAAALLAMVILSLVGCSDNSQSPVAPADQSATLQEQSFLEKCIITNFTFSHYPIGLTGEGEVKLAPGGKWRIKKYGVIEQVNAYKPLGDPNPLVSGTMVHYLSATFDAITGEGPVHGSFTLTPMADVGGGVWEGTYTGYRSKTPGSDTLFTLPLKVVGHGKGGTIHGMQLFEKNIITAWGTPPVGWYGGGEGYIKSHGHH